MVSADDEVGATHILAAQRGEHRLARPGVARIGGEAAKHHFSFRIEPLIKHYLITAHDRLGQKITCFFGADDRTHVKPVRTATLQRAQLNMFMHPVNDVTRMKSDHPDPTLVIKDEARLRWGEFELAIGRRQTGDEGDIASDKIIAALGEARHAGMIERSGTEPRFDNSVKIHRINLGYFEQRVRHTRLARQRDALARMNFLSSRRVDLKDNRQGPGVALRHTVFA